MLTESDTAWIKANREEIVANRTSTINLVYKDVTERDPYTQEPITEIEVPRAVTAVVTELSSATGAGADRSMVGGVESQEGDLWASVNIDLVSDITDKITKVEYDGKHYVILAIDKKGIGLVNRVEILARRES